MKKVILGFLFLTTTFISAGDYRFEAGESVIVYLRNSTCSAVVIIPGDEKTKVEMTESCSNLFISLYEGQQKWFKTYGHLGKK